MQTSKQYRLYDPIGDRILVATTPRFKEGQQLDLPDGVKAESSETVGFDPMEADPPQTGAEAVRTNSAPSDSPLIGGISNTDDDSDSSDRGGLCDRGVPTNGRQGAPPLLPLQNTHSAARGTTEAAADSGEAVGFSDQQLVADELESLTLDDTESNDEAMNQLLMEAQAAQGTETLLDQVTTRRSGRERRIPKRCEQALYTTLDRIPIPNSYLEAINDKTHGADWSLAAREELAQLQSLGTWEVAKLPTGKKALGCRWVFNVKYTPTGLVDRFKARLVAQGFGQVPGDDYLETFSPTIRAESLRLLLAMGAYEDLEIRQIDVVSAYPRSDLHAKVYMRPPLGLDCPKGSVLQLRKSLYGLKQLGREWYIEACKGLSEIGLLPLFSDPSLFVSVDRKMLVGLYVDDMLILSKDPKAVEEVVQRIGVRWKIKDLGEVSVILGIRVTRDRKERVLHLDQEAYIDKVVKRFGLEQAHPLSTPANDRTALLKSDGSEPEADQHLYQQGVGCIAWMAICTRPDVAYAWGQLSQSCSRPTVRNWNGVIHVLRYVKGTRGLRLTFGRKEDGESPFLQGYSDADYAGDHLDRHSVSGQLFILNRGPISWASAKQRCVATSTTEAEYIALSEASKQGQWLRSLLREINRDELLRKGGSVQLFGDNQACIAIAEDPMAHRRTKHIDVRYHYVRQLIAFGKAKVSYVGTQEMLADMLMKPLPLPAFLRCIRGYLIPQAL
jgi:3D (Asp-Asp-Asp) domain-containing protein